MILLKTVEPGVRAMLDALPDPAALLSAESTIVARNDLWFDLPDTPGFGEHIGLGSTDLDKTIRSVVTGERRSATFEHAHAIFGHAHPGGLEPQWCRVRVSTTGIPSAPVLVTHLDISDEVRDRQSIDRAPIGFLELSPDGQLRSASVHWQELRGRTQRQDTGFAWLSDTTDADRTRLLERLATPTPFRTDIDTVGSDGSDRLIRLQFWPTQTEDWGWTGWLAVADDVTTLERLRDLAEDALYDSLTGVCTRRLFDASLEKAIARRPTPGRSSTAVLFIDLDGFKPVNDTLGHHAGDEVLRAVASRITAAVRPSDLVGRLGGDEFAVLIEDVDEDQATLAATRVLDQLANPIESSAGSAEVGASIGIALAHPNERARALVRRADAAMYKAKRAGGHRSVLAPGWDGNPALL